MTHAQWHARVRKSLAMVERQPIRALASLHKLLHQLHSESKKTAGDWHIEQTLEVIRKAERFVAAMPRRRAHHQLRTAK